MGRSNKLVSSLVAIVIAAVAAFGGLKLADESGGDGTPTIASSSVDTTFSPHGNPGSSQPGDEPVGQTTTTGADPGGADLGTISDPGQAAAVAGVLRAIDSGAPLPYDQDGSVFQNREGNLPDLPSGEVYHEYTVPTPGSPDRGARRLVISSQGLIYYTADHYDTFTLLNG